MRVNQLIEPLKELLDNGEIALVAKVYLSYLEEKEQNLVAEQAAPTKDFYRLLMEGQIIHGGHPPVLRWMAGNVVVDTDPAGNIKVTKAKSKEKIDGIVAAIMAFDRCIRNQTKLQGSVYDERGLLIL
jgi:phage terminase large subunit-like protein